ncbi:MAG: thioredoxin domain-containing protein [Propionibacteriaceae bacterium]|nr:thioredoxin domain-containing protein [Propionibacteriaceae bacterium]
MSSIEATPKESSRKGWIAWALAWVLSVVLAFVLGYQMGPGPAAVSMPSSSDASPAPAAGTTPEASQTPDPEVLELLRKLPRRQADDPLAKGRVDAKVVLTEWSDYQCPYCGRWALQTLPELQRYVDDGTLRIEYRDLAVLSAESANVATAARAAGQQGRFWEYYNAVFEDLANGGKDRSSAALVNLARTAGVPDLARFEADLADPALQEAVMRDTQEGRGLGINTTPFFVINTTVINGAQPTAEFVAAIEAHAKD